MMRRGLFSSDRGAEALLLDFCPERLVLTREARGLQKKELAARVELTPSAVSQIELGKIRPAPETLLRLALALQVPPAFFSGPLPLRVPIESCHFRRAAGRARSEAWGLGLGPISDMVALLERHGVLPIEVVGH
jgi:transcriptional regulator with XRE-family HTH domain